MEVREFRIQDAREVSDMIARTLRTVNIRDYTHEYIEALIASMTPEHIAQRAAETHFYVICEAARVIGCGAIGPYQGRVDESGFFTIFVASEWRGRGIGRAIIAALERDEYYLRARRIEIHASITAVEFYRKLGYDYKGGVDRVDDSGLYRLEKFR